VAKPNPDSDEVSLTWADNSKVESGYKIGVRPRGSTSEFSLSKTVAANTTSTTITGLTPGTTFEVIVAAYYTIDPNDPNNEVLSDFSAPAIVTTRNGFTNSLAELLGSGKPFTSQLTTTTSVPRLSWSVEGLPPGLSFNPADGKITGVATRNGVFPVSLRAVYADGSTAGATLTLTVRAAVAPASPLSIPAGDRSVVAGSQTSIPLSGLFSDPDTETAVRLSTSVGNIDILLFPSATPLTVANFLSYVDAGYYTGVAFHRSVPGFVIQGGAYKPVEAPDKFQTIPKLTSPLNEPGITNVAKTIAMAKQEGNANSATSEFFFNLGNNAANLDSQNGGFTAFARVSDSTWGVVEAMALKPTSPYAYALDDITTADVTYSPVAANPNFPWPINGSSAPAQMDNTRTIVINNASRIQQGLSYSVTGNSNPDGVTASISDGNLLISGPLADAQSNLTIEATDLDGLKVSQTFTVRVVASHSAPTITQPPANATATLGGGATFTVTATGSDPLTYQWRKDGINLSGKTGASLPLSNLTYADAGAYSVVVRNSAGSATSSSASLTISGPPTISQQPSDLFRGYGYSATFTVKVAGPGPFTYQWFRGATSVSLTQNSASSTATYPIPAVDISHDGLYRVVITNSLGSTTSTPARLLVVPTDLDANGSLDLRDSDGDGFDDDAEIAFGGDPLSRTRKPATVFVARANALTTLKNLPLRRVPATPNATTFTHSLTGTAAEVPAFWLATQELSNSQFASILQIAYAQGGISIGSEDRPVVTYQGMPVCRLPTYASTDPNGLKVNEVSFDPRGGFYVPIEAANYPVRGVSWYGSFLCAVLMDDIYGLPGRLNIPTWSYAANPGEGFVIPSDAQWEWAAKSGIKNLPYPTGTSVSAALANFASPAGSTKPVNSYAANAFGLFNLAGNVAEWVFDTAEGGDLAYTRGGSWSDLALALSNDQRASRTKASTNLPTGVRLALVDDRSPSFTTSPKHQLVSSSGPLTLSAAASGAPVLTGQWFKNNRPVTGATAPVFTIPSPKLSDAGTYKVTVTNPLNSVTSAEVQAAVIDVPLAPQAVASAIGKPITFRIPHAGQNLAFQWKKDGTDIANGSTYKIERTATFQGSASLTVLSPTLDSGGRYTCVVSQPLLSPAPAPLTITFDLTVEAPPSFAAALPPTTILNL
jgi:cyclophilin family peptidyl-prolyl cis-trans isomerase/formylglycine-generating enzyme required for sulfatase activity